MHRKDMIENYPGTTDGETEVRNHDVVLTGSTGEAALIVRGLRTLAAAYAGDEAITEALEGLAAQVEVPSDTETVEANNGVLDLALIQELTARHS